MLKASNTFAERNFDAKKMTQIEKPNLGEKSAMRREESGKAIVTQSSGLETYATYQRSLVCCLPIPDLSARLGLLSTRPHPTGQGKNRHFLYQLTTFCIAISGKVLSLYFSLFQ